MPLSPLIYVIALVVARIIPPEVRMVDPFKSKFLLAWSRLVIYFGSRVAVRLFASLDEA